MTDLEALVQLLAKREDVVPAAKVIFSVKVNFAAKASSVSKSTLPQRETRRYSPGFSETQPGSNHSVESGSFVPSKFGGLRDQICTT